MCLVKVTLSDFLSINTKRPLVNHTGAPFYYVVQPTFYKSVAVSIYVMVKYLILNHRKLSLLNAANVRDRIFYAWLKMETNGCPWPYGTLGPRHDGS